MRRVGNTKNAQTFGYKHQAGWRLELQSSLWNACWSTSSIAQAFLNLCWPQLGLRAGVGVNGNVHVWGFTLDPVYYYKTTGSWGGYVHGAVAGSIVRSQLFSTPVYLGIGCDFYYGCYPQYANQTVSHFFKQSKAV